MGGLFLASHDPEQFRPAVRADSLEGGASILHGDFLRLSDFLLCLALHTISFSHDADLPWFTSHMKDLRGILLAAPGERQGAKRWRNIRHLGSSGGCFFLPGMVLFC